MSISRRGFLSLTAGTFGALFAGVSLPLRVLAQHVRPDAAFTATDMAGAYAALGSTPETSSDIIFTLQRLLKTALLCLSQLPATSPGRQKSPFSSRRIPIL